MKVNVVTMLSRHLVTSIKIRSLVLARDDKSLALCLFNGCKRF